MQHIAGPPVAEAEDVWQLVAHTGCDQQAPCRDPLATGQERPEPGPAFGHYVGDVALDDFAAVTPHLAAAGGQQLVRRKAVARKVAVHVGGRGVARRTGVHHENVAAGAGKDQGCGQACGASADDQYVVSTVVVTHVPSL